jgi:hypothetical protein
MPIPSAAAPMPNSVSPGWIGSKSRMPCFSFQYESNGPALPIEQTCICDLDPILQSCSRIPVSTCMEIGTGYPSSGIADSAFCWIAHDQLGLISCVSHLRNTEQTCFPFCANLTVIFKKHIQLSLLGQSRAGSPGRPLTQREAALHSVENSH